ncbi:MAG TPA: hypothetical protein VFW23_02910, partial [Tepidisphaeraceae bacterium]|nr:hypothetical protein [Tepidisphaeraceae bacterium]
VTLNNSTLDTSLIQRNGGSLTVTGTLHNLGTIDLDTLGSIRLSGTIDGGTITGTNPNLLVPQTGMGLSNVTVGLSAINANNVGVSGAVTL